MKLTIKAIDALKSSAGDYIRFDDEVRRFGVRVKSSGVKSFVIMYRIYAGPHSGRQRRLTIGQYGTWAPEEARTEAKRLLRLVDQGIDPADLAENEKQAITVAQLCDLYMQAARKGIIAGRGGKPKKASTLYNDESRISAHIRPLLGDKLVKDLTQAEARRFFEEVVHGKSRKVQATGKKRGKSVVEGGITAGKRAVGLMGGMFVHAIRLGYRPDAPNPFHGIGLPADTRRSFRLEAEGWRAYWQAIERAEGDGLAWQAVYIAKLLPLTGCRLDEIVSLRWAEVDFDGRCLRFDPARIKSGPLRPIGREALDLLRQLKELKPTRGGDSAFVFPMTRGEEDGAYAGIRRAWIKLAPGFSPHCLRHAFGSTAEDDVGLHESTVAALFGHSKRASDVTRGYIKKADATLLAAGDKVCRHIWSAMTGGEAKIVSFRATDVMRKQVFYG